MVGVRGAPVDAGAAPACGATWQVLALHVISFWVLRFPLTSLFASWFGEPGLALGMGTSFVVSSAFAALYYRFGRWREKELFANA